MDLLHLRVPLSRAGALQGVCLQNIATSAPTSRRPENQAGESAEVVRAQCSRWGNPSS